MSPTILNASVTLGPVPGKENVNKSRRSELLGVPNLELQKEQAPLPSPQKAPLPPGVNAYQRRGHAHRRSGAISSGDVWAVMNSSAPQLSTPDYTNRAPSPPTVPSVAVEKPVTPGSSPVLSWSAPVSPGTKESTPSQAGDDTDSDTSSAARRRNRVSFIDRVEIIPRPMSASTETSSMTIKCHSGHGSIASMVSLASPTSNIPRTPSPTRPQGRTRSNSQTMEQPTAALRAATDRSSPDRPSTAGAILSSPILQDNSKTTSLKRPATASPTTEGPNASPMRLTSTKKAHKKAQSDFSGLVLSGQQKFTKDGKSDSEVSPKKKKSKKSKKSKKQIKDWAGTILGKSKGLRHSKRGVKIPQKRIPTPPMSRSASPPAVEQQWFAASWNESYVIMPVETSPVFEHISVTPPQGSPVIDLDAALTPFKSSTGPNAGFAAARRRRMHSAGGRGASTYMHRRSESMPEMQLFALEEDEPMDDLYEEDEEEESSEDDSDVSEEDDDEPMHGNNGLGIGMKTAERCSVGAWQEGVEMEWGPDDIGLKEHDCPPYNNTELSVPTSMGSRDPSPRRKAAPADIMTSESAHSSTSTVTAVSDVTPTLDSPMTFVTAASNPNTPIKTEFASDNDSESFDIFADYLGEPGPEMRPSADDIPSLTSSSSTMTMSAAYSGMPSTPGAGDVVSVSGSKERKEKSKRWSRVWGFWRK